MTKKQLRSLEALPDVIDALTSLAEDAERLRAAMAKAAGLGVLPHVAVGPGTQAGSRGQGPTPAPAAPEPLIRQTPERAEYEAQKANPKPYNPEADEPPAQKALMDALRRDPRRQALLQQFAHDAENGVSP